MKKFVYPQFKSAIKKLLVDYKKYLKVAEKENLALEYVESYQVRIVIASDRTGCPLCSKAESLYEKLEPEIETFCVVCPWYTSGLKEITEEAERRAYGCYDIFLCDGYDKEHISKRIKRLEKWLVMIEKYKK